MDGSFQTTRTIKEGEELLVSYGEDYWAEEAEELRKRLRKRLKILRKRLRK